MRRIATSTSALPGSTPQHHCHSWRFEAITATPQHRMQPNPPNPGDGAEAAPVGGTAGGGIIGGGDTPWGGTAAGGNSGGITGGAAFLPRGYTPATAHPVVRLLPRGYPPAIAHPVWPAQRLSWASDPEHRIRTLPALGRKLARKDRVLCTVSRDDVKNWLAGRLLFRGRDGWRRLH